MPKGRKPLPKQVKQLRGSRKCYIRPEPSFKPGMPPMPRRLDSHGRELWRRLATTIGKSGVVTSGDAAALELLCGWYSRMRQAQEMIDQHGPYLDGRRAPWSIELSQASREFSRLLGEFGLTPATRQRVVGWSPSDDGFDEATTPPKIVKFELPDSA